MHSGCCASSSEIESKIVCNRQYDFDSKKLKQMVSSVAEHRTFYTKYDLFLEQCAHMKILDVERLLKGYAQMFENEKMIQKSLLSTMWTHSIRYTVLTRGGVKYKLYPEIVSLPMEKIAKCAYKKNYQNFRASLATLALKHENIREAIEALNRACAQLDMTVESPFIAGNTSMKPLAHIRNSIFHLFNYHNNMLCKLIEWAQLIHIDDPAAIEDYVALLRSTKNFKKFLIICNRNCCCMRSKNPQCLIKHRFFNDHKTCMEQKTKRQMKNAAKEHIEE